MHNKNKKYCSKYTGQKISFQDMGYASNAIMGLYFDPSITVLIQQNTDAYLPDMFAFIKENIDLINYEKINNFIFYQKKYYGYSICDLFL
jgi:hypothetical protein